MSMEKEWQKEHLLKYQIVPEINQNGKSYSFVQKKKQGSLNNEGTHVALGTRSAVPEML